MYTRPNRLRNESVGTHSFDASSQVDGCSSRDRGTWNDASERTVIVSEIGIESGTESRIKKETRTRIKNRTGIENDNTVAPRARPGTFFTPHARLLQAFEFAFTPFVGGHLAYTRSTINFMLLVSPVWLVVSAALGRWQF
ncbi:hypothetical protein EVAR_6056_1 [Eumeta japonica]|uniref:Uncharacterized protein n=1 Tax=Eumeta variegata TaxID=151549 RepID=A0A4C1TCW8_EUMVA|nr:hypothetical protein EVAR_6056_1 [Eumeta japonica]